MIEYSIWPVHYEDDTTKYRVVKYENGVVVNEHVFNSRKDAEKYVEKNNESV